MKAVEIVNILCDKDCIAAEGTVDKFKIGDPEREVSKVATCFIATPDVIRAASAWGADLLITHEPTYYDHFDNMPDSDIAKMKYELLKECGIAIFRYHDHPHAGIVGHDLISEGFVKSMGWEGEFEDILTFVLKEELTPVEILRQVRDKLGAYNGRITGDLCRPTKRVALLLGARGGEWQDFLRSEDTFVAIGGEVCEWAVCEAVRDAAQMGIPKSAIVLGHCLSERDGMKYITELLEKRFTDAEFKYFECGDTFAEL
ncbi:MAG: hypothetical protein E7578_04020 [Ruminococcaceae bacterium]|nr:hypothetical protein [Oscillospiraceae bacterium]